MGLYTQLGSMITTVTNEDKGCMHEHIGSNKYKKYFWEYANDYFPWDFMNVMEGFYRYKEVPISIISIKDLHHWAPWDVQQA